MFTINPVDGEDTLGSKIFINGEELHTSCSVPIYVGMRFEGLVIIRGESKTGGRLCTGNHDDDDDRKRSGGHHGDDDDETPSVSSCMDAEEQFEITGSRTVRLCAANKGCRKRTYTVTGMCVDRNGMSSTKTTTVVSTKSKCTRPDPNCERGIRGNGGVCCPETCGQCGGLGCGARPGESNDCCGGVILSNDLSCDAHPAPCVLRT